MPRKLRGQRAKERVRLEILLAPATGDRARCLACRESKPELELVYPDGGRIIAGTRKRPYRLGVHTKCVQLLGWKPPSSRTLERVVGAALGGFASMALQQAAPGIPVRLTAAALAARKKEEGEVVDAEFTVVEEEEKKNE